MVLDSSAVIAILLQEPEAAAISQVIATHSPLFLSAANLLEIAMVVEARKGSEGARDLDLFLYHSGLEIVPVDAAQIDIARTAWRRYGRGRHKAALNYGDCFAYALAKAIDAPLIYKGLDFASTDLPNNPAVA